MKKITAVLLTIMLLTAGAAFAEDAAAPAYDWPEGFSYDFSDRAYLLPINAETGSKPLDAGFTSSTTYEDSTIQVTITSGREYNCDYWVADIVISDPSQLRTMAAGKERNFAFSSTEDAVGLAKKSKAVVAINGDYYTDSARGGRGFVIRQGALYLNKLDPAGGSKLMDILLIDEDGNFHGLHRPASGEIPQTIGGKRILNAFAFGPILVEDGKRVTDYAGSERWVEMKHGDPMQRMCICQAGPLHYKVICCSGKSYGQPGMTLDDLARLAEAEGVQTAYNLDGGDSTLLYFNGNRVNNSEKRSSLRQLHDIIYFASAEGVTAP